MTTVGVPARSLARTVRAYVSLTKPRIIELLLVTTVPTMIVAERGLPRISLILATLLGGALAAGGANAINCYLERDIDRQMERTAARPLAEERIPARHALTFGLSLGAAALVWLGVTVNWLAAGLAIAALAFYVLVYTVWLKRRSSQNIVIGGAAGCVPVLVGWAAVTGRIGLPAVVLFAIVFYWTPPHFWALALNYRDDYARAGVPMLPVVAGVHETARQILLYSIMLVAVSLMFGAVANMGAIYLVASLVLGAVFIGYAVRLVRDHRERIAMRLFHYSITYLGLLFTAMAVDALVFG